MAREIVRNVSGIEASVGVWAKLPFRVFCPIWKNPWMAFNADTYAHDVLRMLGFNNIYRVGGGALSDDDAGRSDQTETGYRPASR